MAKKSSSNSDKHPYLRGFTWWSQNQFWVNNEGITNKGREYFNDSLNRMQQNERVLSRVDSSI